MINSKERRNERFKSHGNLNEKTYNLVIGACLFYGFALNALMVKFLSPVFREMNPIALLVGYIVLCFAGILVGKI